MAEIDDIMMQNKNNKIAIYGLSTETERFLAGYGASASVAGLLDGFREEGEIYGYSIIPITECITRGVRLIIVVARPGSCKAIAKRIGSFCRENRIALFDVRGKDLLAVSKVTCDFNNMKGISRQTLWQMIEKADVVSFDLFETLVTRKVSVYTDIFELLDLYLKKKRILIPDFSKLRLYAEKELSRQKSPKLVEIYEFVLKRSGCNGISAEELAIMEWELDFKTMTARVEVCEVLKKIVAESDRKVVITTDCYYSLDQVRMIVDQIVRCSVDQILVSSEYGTSKTQSLFGVLNSLYPDETILHIGDDEAADIVAAQKYGFHTCRVYSGADLYDCVGGLGLEEGIKTLSDRIKAGMLVANLFNSPFWFEEENQRVSVSSAFQIGYLFCAPMITDFVFWLKKKTEEQVYGQLLFCARDGFLPEKLYRRISPDTKAVYFLTSRTAAIRAGVETDRDIDYIESMKYFGSSEESLKTRFGIDAAGLNESERREAIRHKAEIQRRNYRKYIEKLDIGGGDIGMFDFVAKGTTQMYLQRLFARHIKGFYFLQLEPEFMEDKGLDIEPYYTDKEKDISAIFNNYYILETMLTSPYPQVQEFDSAAAPVFAKETRCEADIKVFEQAQSGIQAYFEDYLTLVPEAARKENKKLDEKMLALINLVQIRDEGFMSLKVEDPFFGRMTPIENVIG